MMNLPKIISIAKKYEEQDSHVKMLLSTMRLKMTSLEEVSKALKLFGKSYESVIKGKHSPGLDATVVTRAAQGLADNQVLFETYVILAVALQEKGEEDECLQV